MRRCSLKMAVLHVVRSTPKHLNGRFDRSRNLGSFQGVVDSEPSTEPTAYQGNVHFHIHRWNSQELGHFFLQFVWCLRRRPDCAAIADNRRRAIHRFDGGMRIKRIKISRLHRVASLLDVLFPFLLARNNAFLLARLFEARAMRDRIEATSRSTAPSDRECSSTFQCAPSRIGTYGNAAGNRSTATNSPNRP